MGAIEPARGDRVGDGAKRGAGMRLSNRKKRWRVLAAGVALSVVAGGVVATVTGGFAVDPPQLAPVAEAPDEASALVAAQRQGSRVEVAGLRSETARVFANPTGTLALEQSVLPVRTRRGERWVDIDPTLRKADDGSLTTTATTAAITFSGGGTNLVARIGAGDKSMELTWPTALPAPQVDGETAVYPEVLAGVDLRVRANRTGFAHELLVKDARAAANPALREITLGLKTSGVDLAADNDGTLSAVDRAGVLVFRAPPALMWDSPKAAKAGEEAPPAIERRVGVRIGTGTLTLVPDQGLLGDSGVRFPIVIDPQWSMHSVGHAGWTLARRAHDFPHWNLQPTDDDTRYYGVGRVGHAPGWPDAYLDRSYFRFDTRILRGSRIKSASFNFFQVWKDLHTCDAQYVNPMSLYLTGPISEQTKWSNQPARLDWQSNVRSTSKIGHCAPSSWGMNMHNATQKAADNGWADVTVGLWADDEVGNGGWKRFKVQEDKVPWIQVEFNRRPDAPHWTDTEPKLPAPCRWCAGKSYVGPTDLKLTTFLTDPDGGELNAYWRIDRGGQEVWAHQLKGSGQKFEASFDTRGLHGKSVTWSVNANDGPLDAGGLDGDRKDGPGFTVDEISPHTKPLVASTLYPTQENAWHGGVGVPGTFTFGANTAPDVDRYVYGFTDPPSTYVDADQLGGGAKVEITPTKDGRNTLFVQSVDRAGNRSQRVDYDFYVRPGSGATAHWALEDNVRDTAYLGARHGTAVGTVGYGPGAVARGLQLDGAGGHIEVAKGTLAATWPVRTDISFSALAWVKSADTTATRTVVGQAGANTSGYVLKQDAGNWVFGLPRSDSAAAEFDTVAASAQANAWTHLAGVYDARAGKIRLYVNGTLAGEVARNGTPWHADGTLFIGRDANGAQAFAGGIDEVKVYDRVLTASEIQNAVGRDNVQAGHWKFEEVPAPDAEPSTTTANEVDGGAAGVLESGAKLVAGAAVGGALQLDGNQAQVRVPGSVVATDKSFSVAACVKLDREPTTGDALTAVAQNGQHVSGLLLEARQMGAGLGSKWEFFTASADAKQADRPTGDAAVRSGDKNRVQLGKWTHLTAVHDATAGQLRLYVGGELAGTVARAPGSRPVNGDLIIGKARWDGYDIQAWPGQIDEVRAYTRALGAEEIRGVLGQDCVAAGEWRLDGSADDVAPGDNGRDEGFPSYVAGQTSTPDPTDLAVNLDGADDYIHARPAVDTSATFSVAAWVKLNSKPAAWGSVVSQNGPHNSAFNLAYSGAGTNQWAFAMHGPEQTSPTATRIFATQPAQEGAWTHLVGTYSATTGDMRLYVNGVEAATGKFTARWNAAEEFDIGRAKWASGWRDYLPASVDDVRVYSRLLFDEEIRKMSGRDLTLQHNWTLDEQPGAASAADSVGGRAAALQGGAGFAPGRTGNAIALDGVGDHASTTGADIDVTKSFSVSAWVYLNRADGKATAVSLDGTQVSKFRLGLELDDNQNHRGNWVFSMAGSDAGVPAYSKAATAIRGEDLNRWMHLVGTYDAPSRTLWIYVDGTRIGDGTLDNPWVATGGLQIGRGKASGKAGQFWPGMVDDVRVYSGALDNTRVSALHNSYPPSAKPVDPPTAKMTAWWKFDENTGATAADGVGGKTATMTGAGWIGGRSGAAAWFDGQTGSAETAGPVVDTAKSFTVTGWVYLTTPNKPHTTVFGQDGQRVSSFLVEHDGYLNRWTVVAPKADADVTTNEQRVLLTSKQSASISDWTHLGLVYDAKFQQLRLYVNGQAAGAASARLFAADGPFSFGRAKWNGTKVGTLARGLDDVRVFGDALSADEVRLVHGDVPAIEIGSWRFNGSAQDSGPLGNHTQLTATGAGYAAGIRAQGLQLNGTSGAAVAGRFGTPMRDSFTVSAWVKMSTRDRTQTVVAQDGTRNSGFLLRYDKGLDSWVFGLPSTDDDSAALVYAADWQPPKTGEWTALTGVYDYGAQELRLYVNGTLVGSRVNVALWRAFGSLTIGRGKALGKPADFFGGVIDEVRLDQGVMSVADIQARGAGYPAAPSGQLGRYVNGAGDRYTASTDTPPPARGGYHFEATFGLPVLADWDKSTPLYACDAEPGRFATLDAACEGKTQLGEVGRLFTEPPSNLPVSPIYSCTKGTDRFESREADCEGGTRTALLGYTVAYAPLVRYWTVVGAEHTDSIDGVAPAYVAETQLGYVPLVHRDGAVPLLSCVDGPDQFLSTDPACEGKTVAGQAGELWPQPPTDLETQALYRCRASWGELYTSKGSTCEGNTVVAQLGHVLSGIPFADPEWPVTP